MPVNDTGTPEGQAAQAQEPSHGICLVIGWDGEAEPDIHHLPPGMPWTVAVPEGQQIAWFSVSAWEPPAHPGKRLEHGWCVNCQTTCSREEGTETWYNFAGRSECRALGAAGPHQVAPEVTG